MLVYEWSPRKIVRRLALLGSVTIQLAVFGSLPLRLAGLGYFITRQSSLR
jgi:hypothetical protein